ncbi:NUMOD4 domain-containing protein [Dyadobacter tibetensis]|uniref:NUMOD4 domain-containing protein n=1 Tax=Dyadobacter tibetensis TaxID=1211851 RepID=UPI000471271A|nr:HNH endonuclease [Dyadobacter tibetensis]
MSESNSNKSFWNEKWEKINFGEIENPPHYEISNYGRLKSFQNNPKDGSIIKGSVIQGYKSLNIRVTGGKTINRYVHKLVAEHFVEKKSQDHSFVIHKDFEKQNNFYENLLWVTKAEMIEHNRENPAFINRVIPKRTKNYKLTESKVKIIKKLLKNDNNRLKMIAKQFGITHTQLNRIRSGENWKHVTIDD